MSALYSGDGPYTECSGIFSHWRPAPAGWTLLAGIGDNADYGIDVAEVFLTEDGTFVLATAQGCSCWDGEYSSDEYPTLGALAQGMGADRAYPLTNGGADALIAVVRERLRRAANALWEPEVAEAFMVEVEG